MYKEEGVQQRDRDTHQPPGSPVSPAIPSPKALRAGRAWGRWQRLTGDTGQCWGGGRTGQGRHSGNEGPWPPPWRQTSSPCNGDNAKAPQPTLWQWDPRGTGQGHQERGVRTGFYPVPGNWGHWMALGPGWPRIPAPCNTATVSLEVPTSHHQSRLGTGTEPGGG